ncbi:hypothetical protein C2845_PM06G17090 [Panicum miliaceum]|uniref:Uncharacterized protein n=1 Tax=Panicum miliaceum TaxID=4540 RepID=A0A3L6RDI7_PANMI|nr:hypothetical protein C2845_PM06G17090 [Panicum miliaceum]
MVVRHSDILVSVDIGTYSFDTVSRAWSKTDLSAASKLKPPTLRHIWEDELRPPKDWVRGLAYTVHLGSGKFCIARFFKTPEEEPCEDGSGFIRWGCERFAVLTGVEVKRCGEAGGGFRMITHRSKRYRTQGSGEQSHRQAPEIVRAMAFSDFPKEAKTATATGQRPTGQPGLFGCDWEAMETPTLGEKCCL